MRLQLFALAYNLGNFLRRLALPPSVKHWSLTTLREKLIKIGAKVVSHARYVIFQMAEVAVPRKGVPRDSPADSSPSRTGAWMSGTNVESMATKRYRREKYVVPTEKSSSSTSDFTVGAVRSLWPAAQTPDSVCSTHRIGYNYCESLAMVACATPSGKSQLR